MLKIDSSQAKRILEEEAKLKRKGSAELASCFGCNTTELFYKFLKSEIPDEGVTDTGLSYLFHGYGCSIKSDQHGWSVEIEFGPKGCVSSFDKYTLCRKIGYGVDNCDEVVQKLLADGVIRLVDKELHHLLMDNHNFSDWASPEQEMDACVADRYTLAAK